MSLFSRIRPPSDVFTRSTQLVHEVNHLLNQYSHKRSSSFESLQINNNDDILISCLSSSSLSILIMVSSDRSIQLRNQLIKEQEALSFIQTKEYKVQKKKTKKDISQSIKQLDILISGGDLFQLEQVDDIDEDKEEEEIEESNHSINIESSSVQESNKPETMYSSSKMYDDDEEEGVEDKEEIIEDIKNMKIKDKVDDRIDKNEEKMNGRIVCGNKFIVLDHLNAEIEGDLNLRKGDIINIIETRSDGWWIGINERGEKGLVPKTFLAHINKDNVIKDKNKDEVEDKKNNIISKVIDDHPIVENPLETSIGIRENMSSERRISHTSSHKWKTLGDAYLYDKHVTLSCHLTPRLSESNLSFHDLFWNHKQNMLRKRHVRISKLVRIVRIEKMNGLGEHGGLIRIVLFDRSNKTGRQIVSNVHTIRAKVSRNEWTFTDKRLKNGDGLSYGEFLVRSNYRQSRVNLLIQVATLEKDTDGRLREKSIGMIELPLLDESGNVLLTNKSYADSLKEVSLFDESPSHPISLRRIILKVRDPPRDMNHYIDSMADILIISPLHLSPIFYFRRHCGRILIRDRQTPMCAELVNDVLLALFPPMADDYQVLDMMSNIWSSTEKTLSNYSQEDITSQFHQLFSSICLLLLASPLTPFQWNLSSTEITNRQNELSILTSSISSPTAITQFLLRNKAHPLRPHFFSFDLHSEHAID